MNEKNLIKNLTDQEYLDGFVVDKLKDQFITVQGIELQQDYLDETDTKPQGPNSLYLPKKIDYEDLNYGNGLMTMTENYDRIDLGTANFERVIDIGEFESYRVPDNQFQQRFDEKLNNAFDNAFSSGNQANTVGDLIAMQGTRQDLNKEIEAIDEYARTHFLSNTEKQTLKDELIKSNYKKWSNTVDKINNPATDRLPDDIPITNAPRRGIRRDYRSFQPTIMTPELIAAIQRSDGVGYINYTTFVSDNNFKDIATEYFKQGGEFFEFMNKLPWETSSGPSAVIINRLLSLFVPITNPEEYNKAYTNVNNRFRTHPEYFKGLVQAINRISLKEENGGSLLIKYDVTKFNNIPANQTIQKNLLIELLIKMGSSFNEYIGTNSKLLEGLTIFNKPTGDRSKILGQYVLKSGRFLLSDFIQSLNGADVDNQVLLEDPGKEEFKDDGQAAGPTGKQTPTPPTGPPPTGKAIQIDQD